MRIAIKQSETTSRSLRMSFREVATAINEAADKRLPPFEDLDLGFEFKIPHDAKFELAANGSLTVFWEETRHLPGPALVLNSNDDDEEEDYCDDNEEPETDSSGDAATPGQGLTPKGIGKK